MKRLIPPLLAAAVCLLLAAAAAGTVSYTPGPFRFSLPEDAEVTALGVYGPNMELTVLYRGATHVLYLSFTPKELTNEEWDSVIVGLHRTSNSQIYDPPTLSAARYSVNYKIAQRDGQYAASISAGCATGYMDLLCTVTPADNTTCESLFDSIYGTLAYDPSADQNRTIYVWLKDAHGEKYHVFPICWGMNNPVMIPLEEAIRRGIQPCSTCH